MDKPIQYTISFSHFTNNDQELVGVEAIELHQLSKSNIPLPQGFVITSRVFDDFLVANDLVEKIGPLINSIDPNNKGQIKKISREITNHILSGKFPDILKNPILKSYKNLSGLRHATTMLRPSVPQEEIQELEYSAQTTRLVASSENDFLSKVKDVWVTLFTEEALTYREKIDYEGYVTNSVIVQKLVQAEVSGKVYTLNPVDPKGNSIEVQAIFGVDDINDGREIVPDTYFVEKDSEELIEKKIIGQEWMLVRKPKPTDKSPFMKVKISKAWKKRQKLDDRHIINVARLGKTIEKLKGEPQVVSFIVEAGKIFVYDIEPIGSNALIQHTELQELAEKVEVEKITHDEPEKLPIPKSMDDYVEEVKNFNTPKQTDDHEQTGEEDNAQVVVSMEPLSKLEKLLTGDSFGASHSFGLVHFIYTESDWQQLTGDEVLVIDKLDMKYAATINRSRGIVIRHSYKSTDLTSIKVPVIYGVTDAFERLHENEVVTVDAVSKGVYLGAGKKDLSKETEDENTEPQLDQALEGVVPEIVEETNQKKVTTLEKEISFDKVEIITGKFDKKISFSSKIYQYLDVAKPKVDIENSSGLIVDMNDYYFESGLAPEYILKDGRTKRSFIEAIVKQLKPVLEELKGKPIILKTSSLSNEEMAKLEGADLAKRRDSHVSAISNLLDTPQLFDFELEIVSIIRNREAMKNLWLSIADVRSNEDQIRAKKAITAFGFRRSSSFKLMMEITNAYAALAVKEISDGGNDGILINIDKILIDLKKHKVRKLDDVTSNFLAWVTWVVNTNTSYPFIIVDSVSVSEDQIHDFIDKGASNFVTNEVDISKLVTLVASQEVKKLQKKKKRGRKKKTIDYGY